MIGRALAYIKSESPLLADSDLEALAKRVAAVLSLGTSEGNHPPRFNEAGDKALVDLTLQSGSDYLVYTATFHDSNGVWTLRGAREKFQAFKGVLRMPLKKQ